MKSAFALLALLALVWTAPTASAGGKKVKVEKTAGRIESLSAADKDGNETVTIMVGGKNNGHPVKLTVNSKTQIMVGTEVSNLSSLKVGQRVRVLGEPPAVTEIQILSKKPATKPAK
ncbi:MAG TPA: hypothetical protein VH370_00070 [Humisphaera sp.]|jgi:hypothetical protein|nr:hypothetical protein [Humisphaera sp.]